MAEILHPFLTKFRQILQGNIDQYFFEKECFRSSFTPTIRHFETGLFKKSGKSGNARPPRGMKSGNYVIKEIFLCSFLRRVEVNDVPRLAVLITLETKNTLRQD